MEEIKNLSEDLKRITENQEESDNNALTLSCILEKYRDILTNMSSYLNEHFTFIEQQDFRITREKWSLQGPYWSESDINNEFPEYFDKLMKAETSKMEKIERINCVNSNLHTILTWLKEENDRWVIKTKSDLSWMQTEGCVEELQDRNKQIHSVIDLLNQICTLPLAHCEEVIVTEMKRNFIEANYQVIEILKQKNVREDALKKQIESKLSRIRKRCYIALDAENAADFAKVYSKEVEKYLRRFKIARREHTKWKNKMKQTTNAVLKITMDSVNEKECHEDTGVAVLKREDETETSNDNKEKNLPQEILDIPDSCEEKAVREDFAEKNVVENPKDDENVNPMDDAVVKEDSDENIMDPPDVFSNNPHIEDEDDEFTLPNVPDEVPGELDDKDEILHVRLKELKKFRKKHFNEKKKEKVALIVAPFMPTQSAGAKNIAFCPANLKPDTGHNLENTSREAHVTCHVEEPGNKGPYEETSTKFVHSCDLKPCGQKSHQSDFNEELKDNPNENGPQPMLFLWTILMMILIDSIQKMNKRMDLPPARCSCHYSKETARVLAVTKLTMITSGLKAGMLEIQRRTVKWIKQRKEEVLIGPYSF